jgi:hypothetical protein
MEQRERDQFFPTHPMEDVTAPDDPGDVFRMGVSPTDPRAWRPEILEEARAWEDAIFGGVRQNQNQALEARYLQDPRFTLADLEPWEVRRAQREWAAWEEDFGDIPIENEGDLYLAESLGLIEPVEDGDDTFVGGGGSGMYYQPRYQPRYYSGAGRGRQPRARNQRAFVGLVNWRI